MCLFNYGVFTRRILTKKIIEGGEDFSNQFIKDTIIKVAKHIKKCMTKQMYFLELCLDNIMLFYQVVM